MRFFPRAAILVIAVFMTGCGPSAQITKYEAPKTKPASKNTSADGAAGGTDAEGLKGRLLAAMVENNGRVWFFKLMGPDEGVARFAEDFDALLRSVEFVDGTPKWKLPDGWTEKAGSGMRFATINAGQPGMDTSVISLPAPQDVLENVNRWRGQLSSPAFTKEQLADEAATFTIGDSPVTMVNLAGTMQQGGGGPPFMRGGAAPFAGGGPAAGGPAAGTLPADHPPVPAGPPAPKAGPPNVAAAAPDPGFKYTAPEGWQPGRAGGMRKLAFTASNADGNAEFTAIPLPKAGAAVLPNVNRWRGQIGLKPVDEAGLADVVAEIQVSGKAAKLIDLVGPNEGDSPKSMSVVMAEQGGLVWFFKLMGDSPTVAAEIKNFQKLMASIEFPE